MLPAALPRLADGAAHRLGLSDVLPSMLEALQGRPGTLGLRPVDKAVVVLVDGMGAGAVMARSGHARTIAPRVSKTTTIDAGFPTTTASALATLTTGESPGVHGLVGYSVLDAVNDRVVNQLRGWDDRIDPATWQRARTVFDQATDAGIPSFVVAGERYRDSGFTRAVLRGAAYRSGASIADRMAVARRILDSESTALVYVYIPELDSTGHSDGSESDAWTRVLEEVDGAIAGFTATLSPGEGLLVTADHGVVDVPQHAHVLFGDEMADGIRFVGGEPRCLQLYFEPEAELAHRSEIVARWAGSEQSRAWVGTRTQAIEAGWFGPDVATEVIPRIGDIIVAARKTIAYYDERVTVRTGRSMVGQHGSLSPAERAIPLLRFGAWSS